MRNASARYRFVAPMIAAGVLLGGCGQAPNQSNATPASGVNAVQDSRGKAVRAPAGAPGEPVASGLGAKSQFVTGPDPESLPEGSLYRNPANGRDEVIVEDIRHTAVLIGDSQSEPPTAWTRQGLGKAGYGVFFCGLGGTGFVAANGKTGNYIDALQRGDWKLPYGSPPLVVIQGGGNDATRGATDAQIVANAERLISSLQQRYPGSKLLMIGTLARGANYGGGRRTQVDALLGTIAAKHEIPFVSVGDWLSRYNLTRLLADSLHMTDEGNNALGVLLGQRLQEMGIRAEDTAASP
ncbi:SGNH/GDSL hydrolase family protein [Arthrobacter sp. UKPF54-2]|uniref:SGNH/GDSL hydrolase family protein n=1 Tax=Arthrobacter sp. UKPF54-2 TaxID=2600159 RepID=UPI0011B12A0B|nr:SGNH/GDSL hydrolase family protein [Arthrobacter sp. UKPF54-2]QDY90528.1 SGNH/GDSL hydrolase family protein [Arthrobacter sp. UKPF54-2]